MGLIEVFGARFEPVILIHGEAQIYGYRFGSAAYLTDHSEIPSLRCISWEDWTSCFWMGCDTSRIRRIRP